MTKLSLPEFNKVCDELSPDCYTFNSTWQNDNDIEDYRVVNRFSSYDYISVPNVMFFHGKSGDMQFNSVIGIECCDDFANNGGEFNIVCGGRYGKNGTSRYTMWAEVPDKMS